jgi:hypothetical protein
MCDKNVRNVIAKNDYELLCDYDIVMRLTYVLPMIEVMQNLSWHGLGQSKICLWFCDFYHIMY